MNINNCRLCGGKLLHLPIPIIGRSMLSDGRILQKSLEKTSCLSCGGVSHVESLSEEIVKGIYNDEYSLTTISPASDKVRAIAYAQAIAQLVEPGKSVLEIGCGSGSLLNELQKLWPESSFVGIDPTVPDIPSQNKRIHYIKGGYYDYLGQEKYFNLILSVNSIEHISLPQDLFKWAFETLSPGGQLAIFCPVGLTPNLELLIYDHLYTFTSITLASMANAAGFSVVKEINQIDRLGHFQFLLYKRLASKRASEVLTTPEFGHYLAGHHLANQRIEYMNAWHNLDEILLSRSSSASRIVFFGAGQMAALLKTYAPRIWEQVDLLIVDNVDDSWDFEKRIASYSDALSYLNKAAVVIATSPSSQAKLASRFISDGLNPIRFDDIIPC